MKKWFAILTVTLLMPAPATAEAVRVIDGDTIVFRVRLAEVDTPELKGKCAAETAKALEAKRFTEGFLAAGDYTIVHFGIDRFKRPLVTITARDGRRLGRELIKRKLAKPWRGRREDWCKGAK